MGLRSTCLGGIAIFAAGSAGGCGFEPVGASSWSPPAAYRVWWARTQACSATAGSFEEVKWFVVPGKGFDCPTGTCVGRWEPGPRIYLAEAYQHHEMVVRHEMLHALLGRPGHPNPPFASGCNLTWESWRGPSNPSLARLDGSID